MCQLLLLTGIVSITQTLLDSEATSCQTWKSLHNQRHRGCFEFTSMRVITRRRLAGQLLGHSLGKEQDQGLDLSFERAELHSVSERLLSFSVAFVTLDRVMFLRMILSCLQPYQPCPSASRASSSSLPNLQLPEPHCGRTLSSVLRAFSSVAHSCARWFRLVLGFEA